MNPVRSISIFGFKSIKELKDLRLDSLNILIGANGSGKSNFISLFKLLNHIIENNLQLFVGKSGGADSMLHFGSKVTDEIKIDITFGHQNLKNGYSCSLTPTNEDTLIFSNEACSFQDKSKYGHPYDVPLGKGHGETKLFSVSKAEKVAKYVLNAMSGWHIYHFHDTSDSAKVKLMGDLHDNSFFRPNASNLAAFLYFLKIRHKEHYQNIVDTIRMVAPFFDDFELRPSPLNPNKIQLEWKHKGTDKFFGPHAISDGTLRFICLSTLLLQPTLPSTILLDEPELGLHPYAITLLANLLESAATKTQVIVSTQSVTLVNQFKPENIIVVDRDVERSNFRRPLLAEMTEWMDEFGLGDLWEKNIIGGRPQ